MTPNPTCLPVLIVGLLAAAPLVAQSPPSCEQWNTAAFFENATAGDVAACVAAGADPMARGADDHTPLHLAVWHGQDAAVIETLLELGADPNARTNWANETPLHGAENPAAVHALLRAGADVDAAGRGGYTPLYAAVGDFDPKSEEVINALLAAGADPLYWVWGGDPWMTPLQNADDPVVVELLQSAVRAAGQDCDLWNTKRFFQAATPESVTDCLGGGSNPREADDLGRTPLHLAVALSHNPSVVQLLVDAGAELEARDRHGSTPLHSAISNTNLSVIRALLDVGADVEARDRRGHTPLHTTLFSAMGLFNRMNRGSHYAAVVQLLLDAGADMEAENSFGETVIESATFSSELPAAVVQVLRNAAAKLNGTLEE